MPSSRDVTRKKGPEMFTIQPQSRKLESNPLKKSSPSLASTTTTGRSIRSSPFSSGAFDVPNIQNRNGNNLLASKAVIRGAKSDRENLKGNIIAFGLVLSYLIAGIIFYTQIENWSVLNCIYYSIVIVTTVGYGDVTPKTNDGKIFTIFYAFYGIVTIGMALGRLASAFLDRQKSIAKNASRKLLQNVDKAAVDTSGGKSHLPSSMPKKKKTYLKWVRLIFNKSNKAIVLAILPIFVSIGCGLIIGAIEGWPILDCFYYTIITITTIGFGDLSPSTTAGKIVAIFYLPLSVISVAHSIGAVMEEIGKRSVMKQKISMKELIAMDSDGDGQVSQMEYVCYMLVKLGKAEQEDIEEIIAQFRKLDKDGSGVLDKDDLERLDRQLQEQQAREMEEFT